MIRNNNYQINVFFNCPFDSKYKNIFNSIIFTIFYCRFIARCSLEIDDSGQNRFDKITKLIDECKFGIHDLSRTEIDVKNKLPRFNMPLELGLFLGSKTFGVGRNKNKVCLILDKYNYRYQKFISDISGQDIKHHNNKPQQAVIQVRNWLSNNSKRNLPSGMNIYNTYLDFKNDLTVLCRKKELIKKQLTFKDFVDIVKYWLDSTDINK